MINLKIHQREKSKKNKIKEYLIVIIEWNEREKKYSKKTHTKTLNWDCNISINGFIFLNDGSLCSATIILFYCTSFFFFANLKIILLPFRTPWDTSLTQVFKINFEKEP